MLGMRSCKRFWLSMSSQLSWVVQGAAVLSTGREACNKYDLTAAAQCFWLAHHNNSSRWFAISSAPTLFPVFPRFSFMGGVAKEHITKTWMWKIFSKGSHTTEHPWRCSNWSKSLDSPLGTMEMEGTLKLRISLW
jgi:hypothetical protein